MEMSFFKASISLSFTLAAWNNIAMDPLSIGLIHETLGEGERLCMCVDMHMLAWKAHHMAQRPNGMEKDFLRQCLLMKPRLTSDSLAIPLFPFKCDSEHVPPGMAGVDLEGLGLFVGNNL